MGEFTNFKNNLCYLLKDKEKDLYFSQLRDGYSAAYKPAYPNSTTNDFIINTIDKSGAYLRGNYELIIFVDNKVTAVYFDYLDDLVDFVIEK